MLVVRSCSFASNAKPGSVEYNAQIASFLNDTERSESNQLNPPLQFESMSVDVKTVVDLTKPCLVTITAVFRR